MKEVVGSFEFVYAGLQHRDLRGRGSEGDWLRLQSPIIENSVHRTESLERTRKKKKKLIAARG